MSWEEFNSFSRKFLETADEMVMNSEHDDISPHPAFVPRAKKEHAEEIATILQNIERDISVVYDLGAGDFRVSAYLADEGFPVIGYEMNEELVSAVKKHLPVNDVIIRTNNYINEWGSISGNKHACYVCIGISNISPDVDEGVLITSEGESDELSVFVDGENYKKEFKK